MDPTQALEDLLTKLAHAHAHRQAGDAEESEADLIEAVTMLLDLADWLDSGGFGPVCIAEPRAQGSWLYRTWATD